MLHKCKTSKCLVSFKFLKMSCMGSGDHYKNYKIIIKGKYLLGYLFVFLRRLCEFFKASELCFFSHAYSSLHSSISVQDKK